jgi:hypothetical protein
MAPTGNLDSRLGPGPGTLSAGVLIRGVLNFAVVEVPVFKVFELDAV